MISASRLIVRSEIFIYRSLGRARQFQILVLEGRCHAVNSALR
jgi:hypothetical protein